ncbi:unnamed protein product [Nezara viridula]|uniref:Galactose mutarotase n=1 Tax=Nezara viridula TaxID=85310 RepID=A0A9P0MME8_NEZVI|nr:unnamed protein product [Nezara viridula]
MELRAKTTQATPINFTNHSYFNLAGHETGAMDVMDHEVMLDADYYTPLNNDSIPIGEIKSVTGTYLDLRTQRNLGFLINNSPNNGYDNNFCVNGTGMRFVARAAHKKTGRTLEVYSNQPGVQFYTEGGVPEEGRCGSGRPGGVGFVQVQRQYDAAAEEASEEQPARLHLCQWRPVTSQYSEMLVSIHFFIFCTCLTEYFVRGDNPKKLLTHRYHPTTFYSSQKDEPDTAADDIQYAYEGGESQAGEVTNPQDSDYQESNLQSEVQHDYHTQLNHDYQPDIHHDYQPDIHHDYQPDLHHDYQPDLHHDYQEDTGYHDNEPGTGYPENHGYRYNIPEHGYLHEEPSIGYHYPPPPALPALPAAHAMVETSKQVENPLVTYYYLGRHLWYIPLYFSIYFIIYVGALVLKSVARHKIQFPYNLQMAAVQARTAKSLDEGSKKFYM